MNRMTMRSILSAGGLLVTAGVLAACAPAPGGGGGGAAANDGAATRFVACLEQAGQRAKVLDGGQVGLLMPDADTGGGDSLAVTGSAGDGGPGFSVAMTMDEEGVWMAGSDASAYPEAGGVRDAWLGCEAEVPDFEQPAPDVSGAGLEPVSREDMLEAGLAFADCARDEGYADFPDPRADGLIDFPAGMTEDGFRSLLEACMSGDGAGFLPVSPESAESFDFDWLGVMAELGGGATGIAVPARPQP